MRPNTPLKIPEKSGSTWIANWICSGSSSGFEGRTMESPTRGEQFYGPRITGNVQFGEIMNARFNRSQQLSGMPTVLAAAVRLVWHFVRLSLQALLIVFEPIVRWILSLALVLGVLAAVVFEVSAVGAQFGCLQLIASSLGFGVVLILYYGLLALVSR
jgi:hypothetical protein